MKRKAAPAHLDSVFLHEAVGTHGTEVAPGSDVIEKDLQYGCTVHGIPLAVDGHSSFKSSRAAGSDEAGFWPVIRLPSLTTWGCQSAALE